MDSGRGWGLGAGARRSALGARRSAGIEVGAAPLAAAGIESGSRPGWLIAHPLASPTRGEWRILRIQRIWRIAPWAGRVRRTASLENDGEQLVVHPSSRRRTSPSRRTPQSIIGPTTPASRAGPRHPLHPRSPRLLPRRLSVPSGCSPLAGRASRAASRGSPLVGVAGPSGCCPHRSTSAATRAAASSPPTP